MSIEERLENMERELGRQKRRNRWLLGAIVLVAGGLIIPLVFETTAFRAQAKGAGPAREIWATKFVLIDENSLDRAVLVADKYGPDLSLLDENGKRRIGLGMAEGGPYLGLWDENGKGRALLGVPKDGPLLALRDEKGVARFVAGKAETITRDGKTIVCPESSLILFGPDGKVIWSAIK